MVMNDNDNDNDNETDPILVKGNQILILPPSGKNRPKKINWVWGVSLFQYEPSDLP
jgi:hypothetical protein